VRVYDIDDNGLAEIIISGNNETRIYEYVSPGISEETGGQVERISLEVFPNPFRNSTTIRYTIQARPASQGEAGDARCMMYNIKIYDVSGRLVKSFNPESCILNRESVVSWHGRDKDNRQLPSGVYFLQVETQNYQETIKVMFLR
jgi:hypothetical protein